MPDVMTPRERILAAVDRREPDRVPIDIGGSSTTTVIGKAYERLARAAGVVSPMRFMKRRSGTALLDEAVFQRLHVDTRPLSLGGADGGQELFREDGTVEDEWHVVWHRAEGGHFAPTGNPLREATLSDLDRFPWPDPLNPGRTRGLQAEARRLHDSTPYAIMLTMPVGPVHLSQYLRGYENYLMDLILEPEFCTALMTRTTEWWLALLESALDLVGPYVDVIQFGDDVAFQNRPMVDLQRYRRLIRPFHRQMIAAAKRKTRARLLYHCCGSVRTLIPDFIDMGVDALNPVQVSAAGMDTAELKREFGRDISFWGAIDTSRILPSGAPDDVRAEVRRRIHDLAPGGGYIVAAVHNIQEEVPAENILAMADAAYEYGQ